MNTNRGMRWAKRIGLAVITIVLVLVAVATYLLQASLPKLDGNVSASTLQADVEVVRDAQGIPTIKAKNRLDVAYATGFLHGQERFFQMDLLRRSAAGELSALFGERALELDQDHRIHRFLARASELLKTATPDERAMLDIYVKGVNDGLAQLGARPFEYLLLRQAPAPWRAEDSLLVVWAMYMDLQGKSESYELIRGWLKQEATPEQLAFLLPKSTPWDAPMDGDATVETLPIPVEPPSWWRNTNPPSPSTHSASKVAATIDVDPSLYEVGSNNWAVSGKRSTTGSAIISDDMHLSLRLPNIWYRAVFEYPDSHGVARKLSGVTLPGALPVIVAGSNGHVAWGFTNSYGDHMDLIEVKFDPAHPEQYCIHNQCEATKIFKEVVEINKAQAQTYPVYETSLGPLRRVGEQWFAVHWVAHSPRALNFNLQKIEDVKNVNEALEIVPTFGMPAQNIMLGDKEGNIAWTIAGPLLKRTQTSWDASFPIMQTDEQQAWNGFIEPKDYPRIVNPEDGLLWTANNRQLNGAGADLIGMGGFDLGARAKQIRDSLRALPEKASIQQVYEIMLDDRAIYLAPWRKRALDVLSAQPSAIEGHPLRKEFKEQLITNWSGRASADSVGYTLAREYVYALCDVVYGGMDQALKTKNSDWNKRLASSRWPWVITRLIDENAINWIPAPHKSWDEVQLAAIDLAISRITSKGGTLANATWGERNRSAIVHPIASSLPSFLGKYLTTESEPQAGDVNMPRVAGPTFGQSERMAVSPGFEAESIMNMPGGQSGHPLSPYFLMGHKDWVNGTQSAFLPKTAQHTLILKK